MNLTEIINDLKIKLDQSLNHLKEDFKSFKTGRANTAMLDNIKVEAYGSQVPIKQVASIIVIDAKMIQITPFDSSIMSSITTSIRNDSTLGLNPSDDGRVIRLNIPPLTEERRHDLVKLINQKIEECLIKTRTARHETLNNLNNLEKNKTISQDELKRQEKIIEELMQKTRQEIDKLKTSKEQEILSI